MATKTETHSAHITPVGGNIFADLGFEPDEATRLLAESDEIIAEKLVRIIDTSPMVEKVDPALVAQAFGAHPAGSSQGLDVFEVRETMGKLLKAAHRDE